MDTIIRGDIEEIFELDLYIIVYVSLTPSDLFE